MKYRDSSITGRFWNYPTINWRNVATYVMAIGSVLGAVFVVPRVRASFTPNAVTILACAMLGLVYFLIGCINQSWGNARVGTKFAVSITLKVLPRLDIIFQEIMRFFREKMRPDTFPIVFF